MLLIFILISIYISWIWIDYYRLIDVFEKESLKYILLTFVLGMMSAGIVLQINYFLKPLHFELNGDYINDALYCFFKIGLVEELAKLIPFLVIYYGIKGRINEPIDFVAYSCFSSLGFSAIENIMYFNSEAGEVLLPRAILSTVGHLFNSSLIIYGLVLVEFKKPENKRLTLFSFLFLGILSHAFYDFWLLAEIAYGWVITILYFLVSISVFATIINNCLNNSSYFTYKKVIDSGRVGNRILLYYALIILAEFFIVWTQSNVLRALGALLVISKSIGFIVIVTALRLSRFKLIEGRWNPIRVELPFEIRTNSFSSINTPVIPSRIQVKGDSYNEAFLNIYYHEKFYLFPVSKRIGEIYDYQLTYIEKKIFLQDDETFYVAKLYREDQLDNFEYRLLKPKISGEKFMYDEYPIVAILKFSDITQLANTSLGMNDFEFQEWAYVKPLSTPKV